MEHASFGITDFKALAGKDEDGTFEALVAVFGNVDRGGDRVQRGAFKRSLAEWDAKGRSIPVLWAHDAESVPIGVVTKASEGIDGLRVKARLFIEGHGRAREVYTAMKGGALHEFSFGYGVREKKDIVENGQPVRVLKEIDLGEVSPVFRGMNPETRLMAVKSLPNELEDLESKRDGLRLDAEALDRQIAELKTAAEAVVPDVTPEVVPPAPREQEHEDKLPPKSAEVDEEAKARIRALQAAQPQHLETP
jgi:HK97 family phage prohead protease